MVEGNVMSSADRSPNHFEYVFLERNPLWFTITGMASENIIEEWFRFSFQLCTNYVHVQVIYFSRL